MEFMCRKCNNARGFFMQQHGMQIGLYCDTCGTWLKWVGKKEVPSLQNRGIRLFKQNEVVHLKNENSLGVEISVSPSNMGIEENKDLLFDISSTKESSIDMEQEIERRVALKLKERKVQEKLEEIPEYCTICDGSPLESTSGSAKVEVSIFSGVLTITDIDGVEILGLYKLQRCPGCGKIFK